MPMATTWSPTCIASQGPQGHGARIGDLAQADEGDVSR